ncbi:hypothetical protein ACFL7D_04495 [candidate division KSB1 bacterium]
MKKINTITIIILIICCTSYFIYGEVFSNKYSNEYEIIVKADSKIDIKSILSDIDYHKVERLFPDFNSADRFFTNRTGETIEGVDWSEVYIVTLKTKIKDKKKDSVDKIKKKNGVRYAHANYQLELLSDTIPWPLEDIDVEDAWFYQTGSSNVVMQLLMEECRIMKILTAVL